MRVGGADAARTAATSIGECDVLLDDDDDGTEAVELGGSAPSIAEAGASQHTAFGGVAVPPSLCAASRGPVHTSTAAASAAGTVVRDSNEGDRLADGSAAAGTVADVFAAFCSDDEEGW